MVEFSFCVYLSLPYYIINVFFFLSCTIYRYPHLACEILIADVFTIVEALTTVDQYLPMLWKFLYEEPPLNSLIGR